MEKLSDHEEKLREAASLGNEYELQKLVLEKGVDVNSRNKMNGWTALHWACKRGHTSIVAFLLQNGADKLLQNYKGQTPLQVTDFAKSSTIAEMLGGDIGNSAYMNEKEDGLAITPNYIANPPFPYISQPSVKGARGPTPFNASINGHTNRQFLGTQSQNHAGIEDGQYPGIQARNLAKDPIDDELVLKVRVANLVETDFIEIEIDRKQITFQNLFDTMCTELEVRSELVQKIRKLPDTIVRKDKDVKRFRDFQELELVLTNKAISSSSRSYAGAAASANTSSAVSANSPPSNSNLKPFDVVY